MISQKTLLACLLLAALVSSQLATSGCANSTLLPGLATGLISLNPNDIDTSSATKTYYQDLSTAYFQAVDKLGYAFAIAGFEGACSQSYYTLSVDVVEFQNQNTRMRITVNFRSNNGTYLTKWSRVQLSYLIVSRTFDGSYTNIWATTAEAFLTSTVSNSPIDNIGNNFANGPVSASCEMYVDPDMVVDIQGCVATPAAASDQTTGGLPIVHAYIMGFQWNPTKSTTSYLKASVLKGDGATTAESDSSDWTIIYGTTPNGPAVTIDNSNGALEWIKVGFVFSRLDAYDNTYPLNSILKYSSSYVFEQVPKFGSAVPIKNGGSTQAGWNSNYYSLPSASYAIYGFSSFNLPIVSSTKCTSISLFGTLNNINTYTVTSSIQTANQVIFQADVFIKDIDNLCQSNSTTVATSTELTQIGKQSFFSVPTQSDEQFIIAEANDPLLHNDVNVVPLQFTARQNGNNDTITYRAEIPFLGVTPGSPVEYEFGFYEENYQDLVYGQPYSILLQSNGYTLYKTTWTPTDNGAAQQDNVRIYRGLNLNSSTANVVITISFQRSTVQDISIFTYIGVQTFILAYDPSTGCCVAQCPPLNGLDVSSLPPTCVACDTQAGLEYNPANATCTCKSGFYLDSTKTFQCYPCSALYCAVCNPANPASCTTCVQGATLNNVSQTCTCGLGYFINGTKCQQCPYNCLSCNSPTGACLTCADPAHRDISKGCACVVGFFDNGNTNCAPCSPTCLTCNNSQNCSSCDATKFRNQTGPICSCMTGYYELYLDNLTKTCQKCSSECLTCSISPTSCLTCDPSKNRVLGMDTFGHQTCLCLVGFYSTPDGTCVQSDCNADPFCSKCEQGLKQCIQCLATANRVLKQPEGICVCADGFYPDNSTKKCLPCASGCGKCTSNTSCTSCVVLATSNNATAGTCLCPNQTFFTISPDGVRYCSNCGPHCQNCVNFSTCATCAPGYTKTVDNQCVCSPKYFVDPSGKCVPCATGCQICNSSTSCQSCINPLVLQSGVCQTSCSSGFTLSGSVCLTCSDNCLQCTSNFICYYCANNYYSYNGNCYKVCPAGTLGDSSTGNWKCVPCNSPCKTCMNHPSFCTSCEPGQGYLQTSSVNQSCVQQCGDGTFPLNGVCQVCDFKCASCLGTAVNCIACPAGQILYKGGCWASCPAILINAGSCSAGGCCVDTCPDGFYNYSANACSACSAQCATCAGGPDNCTTCLNGALSQNGTCVISCAANQYSFRGVCVACSSSCNGCTNNPQNCIACAAGYVRSGSLCQKSCLANQFFNAATKVCVNCDASCATCIDANNCATCANSAIVPRGGVCSKCPFPCNTCDASGVCLTCLNGYFLSNSQCVSSCPGGAQGVNGICQCTAGVSYGGQCVNSCVAGSTNIGGVCQTCDSSCAECSGKVTTCTKCLSGYTLTNSSTCVSASQCPYGQELYNGVCQQICDAQSYFYEGICIFGGCLAGYSDNGFGGCIRSGSNVPTTTTCPTNKFLLNSQCVSNCGSGYSPNAQTGNCDTCPANCVTCFSSTYCITCQSNFQYQSGQCVASSTCANNQVSYGNGCISTCPIGTFQQNGVCLRSCPANTYYLGLVCYQTCPSGIRTDSACVNNCPANTLNTNGVCI